MRKETGRKERSNESRRGRRGERTGAGGAGGAEEGRKIPRACTLADHTKTQSAAGGRSHLLAGGKKNRETLLAMTMRTMFPATGANVKLEEGGKEKDDVGECERVSVHVGAHGNSPFSLWLAGGTVREDVRVARRRGNKKVAV